MAGFTIKNGILNVDDVPLTHIAETYDTPCYVYSASKIREKINLLQSAFEEVLPADRQPLLTYACKANSNQAVLKIIQSHGVGADIVSGGEMKRSLAAGIPADKIIYSGVGKNDEEIIDAIESGLLQLNIESSPEYRRIKQLAEQIGKTANVAFRLNPNVDAATHAKITTGKETNKFGINAEELLTLYKDAAQSPHVHPRGITIHIGSQLTQLTPYREAFEKVAEIVENMRSQGLTVESIDLGGGLNLVYKDEPEPDLEKYASLIAEIIEPLGTQIILEPGRFLTGDAGILLSRVLYVKENKSRKFLILDAGMNDLIRPTLYDAYHPVVPVEIDESRNISTYDIVGPVCETGDTFTRDREIQEMQAGELAAIMISGAYGYVMSSNYNSRPRVAEILVDGDKHAVIRNRETIEDIIKEDKVPSWL